MPKIKIITDSSSGISQSEAKELGIEVVPMPLVIDNKEYLDGIDLFYEQAIDLLMQKKDFKTSQPLPKDLITIWDNALLDHDYVVYIPISSGLSGSCVNAYTLSKSYEGKVIVVDAKAVELPLKILCLQCVEMVKHGMSGEEIKDTLEKDFKATFACIVPESLETLKRGGRITPAAAAVAGLLKIQPVLKIEFGNVDLHAKIRTLKKAHHTAYEVASNVKNKDDYYWLFISVGLSDEEDQVIKAEFETVLGRKVDYSSHFTPIIMAHTGNRTIGVGHIKKYY